MVRADEEAEGGVNDPRAFRMAVIAFLNQNITIACTWGSFSVLLGAVEARLGIGREYSTLAVPLVNLATALCAPLAGGLVARHSLRTIMLLGTVCSTAGFVLLATSHSFALYLLAYGLLLGPGMAVGAVLPATLVTRWYVVNRGRALGIVCMPLIVAIVPLLSNWTLQRWGVSGTYALLAGLSGVALLSNLLIVDRPPGMAIPAAAAEPTTHSDAGTPVGAGAVADAGVWSMGRMLASPPFWALAFAFIASIVGSMIITAHMVPMAQSWGYSASAAALLLTAQSLVGIAGTVLFGWVADKLGGARTLAIIVFDAAVLWLLLLLHLPFGATILLVGLIGLHGAGAVPVLSAALAERFGRENFSRAYGLINFLNLPFSVVSVPAAGLIFTRTGSYTGAILAEVALLLLGTALLTIGSVGRPRRGTAPI